jgi:hypothetical protein
MEYLYNAAPRDGTVFGAVGPGAAMEPLLGSEPVEFDPLRMNWLGSMNSESSVCVSWHDSDIDSWSDLLSGELIVGGTGSGGASTAYPAALRNVLGAQLRVIGGYPGVADIVLAMERGEVEGICGWGPSSIRATHPGWIEDGTVNLLVQLGPGSEDLPGVPMVTDLAKSDDEKRILELIFSRELFGRPFVAPPEIPVERLEALRTAFMATLADPLVIAEARQQSDLALNPVSGEEIAALLHDLYENTPPELVEAAAAAARD